MNIVLAASVGQYKKWINDNKLDPFEYKYLDKSIDGKEITNIYFVEGYWRTCPSCIESQNRIGFKFFNKGEKKWKTV